jgi:hypothetical protein
MSNNFTKYLRLLENEQRLKNIESRLDGIEKPKISLADKTRQREQNQRQQRLNREEPTV